MNSVIYEIKKLKGFILGIGNLPDKMLDEFNKNPNIEVSIISSNDTKKGLNSNKKEKKKKGKNINFKKLRKYFKKKKTNYIICNIDDIKDYLKYFVKDSLIITSDKIYIYSQDKEVELESLQKKYARYNVLTKIEKKVLVVDTTNYKRNIFKNIYYFIIDTFINIYNFIGTIIAS